MLHNAVYFKDIVSREVSGRDREVTGVTNVRTYVRVDWHDQDKRTVKAIAIFDFPNQISSVLVARSKQAFSATLLQIQLYC